MSSIAVYVADQIRTMNPEQPTAGAVAVDGDRIVAVGGLDDVIAMLGDRAYEIDSTFADRVILPGLIDQHLHPILGATTLTTAVVATEDWVLPSKTFPAAHSHDEYLQRLAAAEAALDDTDEWLFSWGYHSLWHGELSRSILDTVSAVRPIAVWQRSCHEFYLNSAAIDALQITPEMVADCGDPAESIDLERGHFWERGAFTFLMPLINPAFITLDRMVEGVTQLVGYLHQNGVTAINEPGAILAPGAWELYQAILGADETPFSTTFLVDARGPADNGISVPDALRDAAEIIAERGDGKVCFLPKQVKLFADGAIISQLMQMRDGYVDADGVFDPDHHGEWLMPPETFEERAKAYWDEGYQLHIHVNGDLGLDMVLAMLDRRLAENPRPDHRTVIVHFANSTPEQVDRIADLGAIVSSNPYYPVGFADKYGEWGLGPERADVMTRNRSVLDRDVALSFHSDLPMGRADPIGMMHCAVNRITQSGRVAGPQERVTAEQALHAVTLGAAHSWRREHELGSIEIGKFATFTIVDSDPVAVDPLAIDDIEVHGVVFEGRWFPVPEGASRKAAAAQTHVARVFTLPASSGANSCCSDHGCACEVAALLTPYVPPTLAS